MDQQSGPSGWTGPIGREIQFCETLPIVDFVPISITLPELERNSLSSDQKYLLDICTAVSTGYCLPDLALRNPGKLNHARWVTTANRILLYYVGCSEPSNKLQQIVEFVMKVYCQMWFTIKSKPSCTEGARHLWQTIHLLRYASSEIKAIVYPVIQRNRFFAHPENLLLSMISDSRPNVRKLGLLRIMKARSLIKANIRQFSTKSILKQQIT